MRRADLPLVLAAGVLDASANVSFAAASREGLLSVVAVLSSLYPVATVVLARTVLGERLGRGQALGVGAALAGVGLIALGAPGLGRDRLDGRLHRPAHRDRQEAHERVQLGRRRSVRDALAQPVEHRQLARPQLARHRLQRLPQAIGDRRVEDLERLDQLGGKLRHAADYRIPGRPLACRRPAGEGSAAPRTSGVDPTDGTEDGEMTGWAAGLGLALAALLAWSAADARRRGGSPGAVAALRLLGGAALAAMAIASALLGAWPAAGVAAAARHGPVGAAWVPRLPRPRPVPRRAAAALPTRRRA